jgi:TolB protein
MKNRIVLKAFAIATLLLLMAAALIAVWADVGDAAVFRDDLRPAARGDDAEQIAISVTGSLQNPAWSPDSDQLLFTRFGDGYNAGPADLFIIRLSTGAVRFLVSNGDVNVNLPGSAWNRITDHIVFSSERDTHDEIYTLYADGPPNNEWQVTDRSDRMAYEPTTSRNGEWVVFESHPLDVAEQGVITKYKIDDSQPYQALTAAEDDCRQPNWSPADDGILYQKFANGQWDIWVMKPDGTAQRQVTAGGGDKTDASFSPDGRWIVYSSDEGGLDQANLFVISVNGGASTRLTTFDGYDGAPSWSPDGRWIAFESTPGDPDGSAGSTLWRIPAPEQFRPALLFDGGFESGDALQWSEVSWNLDRPQEEQMQIITDTVRQGRYAAKMIVHDGDEFMETGGERVQFARPGPDEHEGDDYWYAWSTLFPSDWQPTNDWLLILDWHATYDDICQPLQFELDHDNQLIVHALAGDVTGYDCFDGPGTARNESQVIIGQLTLGKWNDFILHVKWTTSNTGLIEVWHELEDDAAFTKVLTWRDIPTLQYKGDPANANVPYLIQAHYRDASNTHTGTLFQDGFRMADSWQKLVEDGLYDLQSPDIYFPMLLIDALDESDVQLSWGHDAAYASYRGWRSNTPYFSPPAQDLGAVSAAPWRLTDPASLGDPASNHYYVVEGVKADGSSTLSGRVGEFDFEIK